MSVSVFDRSDDSQDLRATISPLPAHVHSTAPSSDYGSERSPDNSRSNTVHTEPHSTTYQAAPSDVDSALQSQTAGWVQSQQHEMDYQIALDFVLGCVPNQFPQHSRSLRSPVNDRSADERNLHSLEQPCLGHHRTHSFPDGETNGHVLMIQSPILSRCPAPLSTDSKTEHIDTSCTWSAPALEIEKLMALSTRLTLDGEITPVEAWRRITQHPGFQFLDKTNIESLKERMLPEIMCYG